MNPVFDQILYYLPKIMLVIAAFLSVAAGVGLLRFSDVLTRLHAATKPQVFGLLLVLLAIAIEQRSWLIFFAGLPVFVFQSLTAPVAAHMVGRASYRTGRVDREHLFTDQLGEAIEEVTEQSS